LKFTAAADLSALRAVSLGKLESQFETPMGHQKVAGFSPLTTATATATPAKTPATNICSGNGRTDGYHLCFNTNRAARSARQTRPGGFVRLMINAYHNANAYFSLCVSTLEFSFTHIHL
jgi:hypothetical protein